MLPLTTERLQLIPLTLHDLELALADWPAVERGLGLGPSGIVLSEYLRAVYRKKIANIEKSPADWLFCTYWELVPAAEGRIAGEIGFKGPPNVQGALEVGFGLEEAYRGRGYMTEALAALMRWAFAQPGIETVLACTDRDNLKSQAVLKRAGMKLTLEDGEWYWWAVNQAGLS